MDKIPLTTNPTTTTIVEQTTATVTTRNLHSGTLYPWTNGEVQKDMLHQGDPGTFQV